tara:strand:- start:209 stop:661 length:453 start_codon:yes stop_codon:yes gene_type:complete
MNKYKITKYQTSVNIDLSTLSKDQLVLRSKEIEEQGKKKICKTCLKNKLFDKYRLRLTRRGVTGVFYDATCKDCYARKRGTKEIGKLKYAKELFNKGLRRCTTCKDTKLLSEYFLNKASHSGIMNSCKDCSKTFGAIKYKKKRLVMVTNG